MQLKEAKRVKPIKESTIFIITLTIYILYLAAQLLFIFSPSSSDRLRQLEQSSPSASHQLIDNLWAYYIINEDNPLREDFTVGLDTVQGNFMLDERCAGYARQMIADAEADGIYLCVVSAYRSVDKQQENLESYTQRLIDAGYSKKDARKQALREIAEPYTSEHNAGLALDILTYDWWETHDDVTADFENTAEFAWLNENAQKYGFIMRYPKEFEDITGYTYEPWHYRFIGVYYAQRIKESGLPLEYFYKMNF